MNKVRMFDLKALIASIVIFAVLQGLMAAEIIGPFWELNLVLIGINIILASSLNMINGFTGQFSIGHAGFLAVGAYMGAVSDMILEAGREYVLTGIRTSNALFIHRNGLSDFAKSAANYLEAIPRRIELALPYH